MQNADLQLVLGDTSVDTAGESPWAVDESDSWSIPRKYSGHPLTTIGAIPNLLMLALGELDRDQESVPIR
jgi:hypothetical protein